MRSIAGWRDIDNPEHRAHVAGVWGISPDELPGKGVDAYEIFRKIDRGEVRGLLSICFNPKVSLPDNNFIGRMLDKLDFYVAIDFFLNESARHADVVLPGSLQEEDEGLVTSAEGRVIKINKCVDPPGEARQDWRIIQDLAQGAGPRARFHVRRPAGDFRRTAASVRRRRRRLCGDYLRESGARNGRLLAVSDRRSSRNPAAVRAGHVEPGRQRERAILLSDGKARFNVATYSPPAEDVDAEYPIMLTTGRVVSHFLSGTQTRRIGPLVDQYPEPRVELHPQLAAKLGIQDQDWTTVESRRGSCTVRAEVVKTIRPDTVFVPYHWSGLKSINQVTIAAQDPISKIPEYKICAVRVFKAAEPPEYARQLEPQQ